MSFNKANVFSSKSLCGYMLQSLPPDASPHLRNPYDAVALLGHASFLAVGFRLEGLGEDHHIESHSDRESTMPLPSEWNSTTTSDYAFRYVHSQSSLHYILKISRLGSKAIANALNTSDEKVYTAEIAIKDFISQSSFPFTLPPSSAEGDQKSLDTDENEHALSAAFISPARITDLGLFLKLKLIQKLAPGLQKEGYEESAHAASSAATEERRQNEQPPQRGDRNAPRPPSYDPLREDPLPPAAQPRPYNDPLAAEPRRPYPAGDFPPPGFEDEYEINRPPGRGGLGGERRPLNIGERDLYPPGMGPHDPLRAGPGFGGGGGGFGGGGMHPTFDDPLFRGQGGAGRAPPGARYDPVGPGDGPPNLRGGPRFPGGGGGGPPNPFGGFGGGDFI